MTDQRNRLDVTERVYGKLDNGDMNLYLDKQQIGRMVSTPQGYLYEMADGFDFDQNKIYENVDPKAKDKKYVDDCDLGWC